ADLNSEMVFEFPELQGLMGRYYIEAAGEDAAVAAVAQDHYSPLGPSDDVPTAPLSVTVALADKLDTLTGFWAIDEKPTGSKDPFALRRAALGVIRLNLDTQNRTNLKVLFESSFVQLLNEKSNYYDYGFTFFNEESQLTDNADRFLRQYFDGSPRSQFFMARNPSVNAETVFAQLFEADDRGQLTNEAQAARVEFSHLPADIDGQMFFFKQCDQYGSETAKSGDFEGANGDEAENWGEISTYVESLSRDLLSFFHDRLKVFLRDEGIRHDIIDACIAMDGNDDLTLLVKRARALNDVIATEDGKNLVQGFKRANNILTQAEDKDGVEYSYGADLKFAEPDSEKALFAVLDSAKDRIDPALKSEDFPSAMAAMAALRGPIDAFFEDVQINTDNAVLRRNRLNLLSQIRAVCGQVADLSRIEG
ncbi:MAG: glycine--tRNA ligase subunit beta, partial [Pseudomonadota bacterium]